jgi:ketosteroid isomerase-like protein
MIRTTLAALALAAVAASAHAQTLSPEDIVHRHMDFAGKGDVDGIVGDYADDAVTVTSGGATVGKDAIRALFTRMFGGQRPAAGPGAGMKVDKIWSEGNVGFVSWEQGALKGTDAFVVKNGKIQVQSVFLPSPPPAPPAAPAKP